MFLPFMLSTCYFSSAVKPWNPPIRNAVASSLHFLHTNEDKYKFQHAQRRHASASHQGPHLHFLTCRSPTDCCDVRLTPQRRQWGAELTVLPASIHFIPYCKEGTTQHEEGWQNTALCENTSPGWALKIEGELQDDAWAASVCWGEKRDAIW